MRTHTNALNTIFPYKVFIHRHTYIVKVEAIAKRKIEKEMETEKNINAWTNCHREKCKRAKKKITETHHKIHVCSSLGFNDSQ